MLSSVDEVLAHAGVYDPAARRERYLQDRLLKGRAGGQQPDSGGNQSGGTGGGSAPVLRTKAQQAASATRQVAALQARLSSLKGALQKLLAEAVSSSSSATPSSSSTKKGGATEKGEPSTAAEKADARKASEKYRDKNPEKTKDDANKAEPTKEEKIAHLRSVIKGVESQLRAALERARNQTAPNSR